MEGFLVFWDVMLAGQVVADVLEDHVAFILWHKPLQEVCMFKVSGTARPAARCLSHLSRQNVVMMQVSVAVCSHVGYGTAVLVGSLLLAVYWGAGRGPAAAVFRAVQEE